MTIEILGLNREDLLVVRRQRVAELGYRWVTYPRHSPDWVDHIFADYLQPERPYLSCTRFFLALCQSDPIQACALARDAQDDSRLRTMIDERWPG